MRITYKGKNIDVTPALKEHAEKKLSRLERIMDIDSATVTMVVEKNNQRAEVNMAIHGFILRGEVVSDDMYGSLDLVADKMEKQLVKYKEKLQRKNKKEKLAYMELNEPEEDELVRTKRFTLKPMTTEEAIMQMNMLGHTFFVFANCETESVNVVYCRKDGKYGVLEPEF